jgi:hypothetical protein
MGQPIAEQNGIEFVRLTVDVEISAREMRMEKRGAKPGHESEKLLDIGVFRAPQSPGIEPRGGEERARIDAAAMWRVEDERDFQLLGEGHREGRRKLTLDSLGLD